MKNLLEFRDTEECVLNEEQAKYLEEKLIMINQGKKYGQIVFLAGGGGSGKGFAAKNFMEADKFKVRDVDEWKRIFLKIEKETGKHPELKGLNLRNPDDVFKLHKFVDDRDIKNKTLSMLLRDMKPDRLPNIIFDITAKNTKSITKVIPLLTAVGYDTEDIHLVWVLTNYRIAVERNAGRSRVVPEDILLQTHEGAAKTVYDAVTKGTIPRSLMDGGMYVILNNQENTVFWTDKEGNRIKDASGNPVIKDFTYLTVKEPRKSISSRKEVQAQLYQWVIQNVPKTKLTKDIFSKVATQGKGKITAPQLGVDSNGKTKKPSSRR
jgi:dephospho-CoA kinase